MGVNVPWSVESYVDFVSAMHKTEDEIRFVGENKIHQEAVRQQNRSLARKLRKEILRRQVQLETEIDLLFPIPKRVKMASLEE